MPVIILQEHVGVEERRASWRQPAAEEQVSAATGLRTGCGGHASGCFGNVLHRAALLNVNIFMLSLHLPATLTGVSCNAQDHFDLRICRAAHVSATCAYRLEALNKLDTADCMRASVHVVLRARFVWTRNSIGSVHRRLHVSGGYRYGALLGQK